MKKDQIRLGGTYLAKITDKVVPVRLDAENRHGGWDAINLVTNKKVRIKSVQRLRGPAPARDARPRNKSVAEAQAADAAANAHTVPAEATTLKQLPAKKAAAEPKTRKPSGLDAAAQVLADAGEPMRCGDMVKKMLSTGLWKTDGKTPAATIYAAIIREISTKGEQSRFRKTNRGLFTLNAQ